MNNKFLKEAILEATKAAEKGEVPVGAVVVRNGEIIGRGFNKTEETGDPTAHAEVLAIRNAAETLGSWRLDDCDLYVTLEPCPMCAGAIINSRIKRVYFGAYDLKGGAASNESVVNLFNMPFQNTPETYGGLCEKDCAKLLTDFFKKQR